ncbi:MAG TPA: ATP-dependent RNA helicase HrpA [Chitinivibrionales bacterium]|nr:ATP-dependent RNA helicase HrpA [Chitinivibrionales bacterium]
MRSDASQPAARVFFRDLSRHAMNFSFAATLPIYEKKDEIIRALRSSPVVIVAGETGSGKTTQLPFLCLEAGYGQKGKIGITQPRRLAATSVAAFAASQASCALGTFVGYKVRFNDRDSAETKIKFMTDGILLRELQTDRFLNSYDVVVIDEAHERSLNIDFLLGYFKMLLPRRPGLRLVISSATINTALFSKAFDNAPVITVSGRLFPVETIYLPDKTDDESDASFINAAADAVDMILREPDQGDILVFMPTERDILETKDLLQGRLGGGLVVPLFGRMPLADQTSVFRKIDKQKIVVATNIAETSITVPGIRYVVDTGLARVKRFDPSMGITRLPVEPVSQASAAQRAGRCGRVRDGVCVRLYSEQDLLSRPQFTMPEIQRANLGQVILSMASLRLGKIEDFPFLEPPARQAVSHGYSSLIELGALDEKRNLTDAGRSMARFPLDPALSRMIIEAHRRHCIPEITVIASALCIQDMRVRPSDKKDAADAAHAQCTDPMSDFLFYLKLWNTCGFDRREKKSFGQLKKFCKENFLSFVRMREWQDIHKQLLGVVTKKEGVLERSPAVTYEQIHCCITAGFISHIGNKNEDGSYHIAKARKAFVFPGSALFKKKPDWIVSAELVETSRLYSRTCASIDPLWLEAVAPHLCNRRYSEPFFDEETGGVKAKETVSLFGLVIVAGRTVGYGRINPKEAAEVFIREGLVAGKLRTHHGFFQHNQKLCNSISDVEKKLRTRGIYAGDESVYSFYSSRLDNITSVHELNAVVNKNGSDGFLYMKESDVLKGAMTARAALFPDSVVIGAAAFPITYEFDPSSELDGATAHVPSSEFSYVNDTVFDWIVPGLFAPRIQYLLGNLPKSIKKLLEPVPETAQKIASSLVFCGQDFIAAVCDAIKKLNGITLDPSSLPIHDLPPHLMVKIAVKKGAGATASNGNSALWHQFIGKWERKNIFSWDFGDLPDIMEVIPSKIGFPVFGFKGLAEKCGAVECLVFTSREERANYHPDGVKKLLEISVEKELAWFEKEIKVEKNLELQLSLDKKKDVKDILLNLLKNHCFGKESLSVWKKSDFEKMAARVKREIAAGGDKLISSIQHFGREYPGLQSMMKNSLKKYPSKGHVKIAGELARELIRFLELLSTGSADYTLVINFPRYLRGFSYRIQRTFSDIGKYLPKHKTALDYTERADSYLQQASPSSSEHQKGILEFALMVEEFKISLFAQQEVKTLFPVSQKRLDEKLEKLTGCAIKKD